MAVEQLTSLADPRVARYRDISDAELLRSVGWFVAEGRLVVRRVIETRAAAVQSVLVNAAAYRSLAPQLAALAGDVPIWICEGSDFLRLTGFDLHRGCLALVVRPPARSVRDLLTLVDPATPPASARHDGAMPPQPAAAPASRRDSRTTLIVLEGVTNPDNVGGTFRNAAAFGVAGVLLDPASCDPLYRKSIRTSMAAVLEVPFARVAPWPGGLDEVRAAGFTIVALTPRRPSVALDEFAATLRAEKIALLVGTEGEGLSPAAEAAADVHVRIPIAPAVDSLNLAVAVGIALHRIQS